MHHDLDTWLLPLDTPWGRADTAVTLAEGIISVDTPGHGGIHLDPVRSAAVPAPLRRADGWYEEDCESAIVALAYPDLGVIPVFDDEAHRIVAEYWPAEYCRAYPPCAPHWGLSLKAPT